MAKNALSRTQKILSFKEKVAVEAELRSTELTDPAAPKGSSIIEAEEQKPLLP